MRYTNQDKYNLHRFVKAQINFPEALEELKNGKHETYWMRVFFPIVQGLREDTSAARYYSISGKKEALAYLEHPLLGPRLEMLCNALLKLSDKNPVSIFGEKDSEKVRSSVTLFWLVSRKQIFKDVLDKFFNGEKCAYTVDYIENYKKRY